mmetsp:Transcript_20524/g.53503  ORF Transcript_20524/g.53503 Transcript_20524/m.53503 type:complete len:94 (-) Transcript_20524:1447-1728(-)
MKLHSNHTYLTYEIYIPVMMRAAAAFTTLVTIALPLPGGIPNNDQPTRKKQLRLLEDVIADAQDDLRHQTCLFKQHLWAQSFAFSPSQTYQHE